MSMRDKKRLMAVVGSLVILNMLLISCGLASIPTKTATVPGQTSTPTLAAPTLTPSATPTMAPTIEPTAEPTATETAVSWTESRYYEPGFKLEIEGSVEGVTVPFTIGLHPSIMNRESEPIVSFEVNRPETADVYAKFWMTMCWKQYERQHPEAGGISFTQYAQLVKDGGGQIEVAAVDEATEDQNNKLLSFEPQKGFVFIATDPKFPLPEQTSPGEGGGLYFGRSEMGQLIIVSNGMASEEVIEQRGYDGYNGWSGEAMVGMVFSIKVAVAMEMFLSTNNADLLSSRRYYSLTDYSLIDNNLYLDPQVIQPMANNGVPFFSIGQ